jgi:hypothetical protein
MEADGSVRIAWTADDYVAIHVYARFWPAAQLREYASAVADAALTNRSVADLRRALRRDFGGQFEMEAPDADAPDHRVAVRFHPPPGTPNPDALDDL